MQERPPAHNNAHVYTAKRCRELRACVTVTDGRAGGDEGGNACFAAAVAAAAVAAAAAAVTATDPDADADAVIDTIADTDSLSIFILTGAVAVARLRVSER